MFILSVLYNSCLIVQILLLIKTWNLWQVSLQKLLPGGAAVISRFLINFINVYNYACLLSGCLSSSGSDIVNCQEQQSMVGYLFINMFICIVIRKNMLSELLLWLLSVNGDRKGGQNEHYVITEVPPIVICDWQSYMPLKPSYWEGIGCSRPQPIPPSHRSE